MFLYVYVDLYRFYRAVMGWSYLDSGCDFLRFPLLDIPEHKERSTKKEETMGTTHTNTRTEKKKNM